MRYRIPVLIASAGLAIASPTAFSVHDDILAFPQYEVVFSNALVSELDAKSLLGRASTTDQPPMGEPNGVQPHGAQSQAGQEQDGQVLLGKETYEAMWLDEQEYLCSVPIIEMPPRNETSEAEAIAEEKKELARATDRGWELLQDLGGGHCLYFVSGWWSYSFCYNEGVTQFHQGPPQPGKNVFPPQRDPNFPQYVLGRVKAPTRDHNDAHDEPGHEVGVHENQKPMAPSNTELQVKGETRYLVQKLDSGTACDLTKKPRRIEIQYHCNLQTPDRIAYIKEVTTCAYLMVIHTPRLCNDVAFLPPKRSKANRINCRQVVPDSELSFWEELSTYGAEPKLGSSEVTATPLTVGGVVVGGGKYYGGNGKPILALPKNFQSGTSSPAVDVLARSKGKTENNKVEFLSDEALTKLDVDPELVAQLKSELQKRAGDRGWKLEVVDVPGDGREIRGVLDPEEEEGEGEREQGSDEAEGEGERGSEETYQEM